MKADEKKCPRCAEAIKKAAVVCKHCGYEFSKEEIEQQKKTDARSGLIGCGVVAVLGLLFLTMCTGGSDPEAAKEAAAKSAEDRRKGFHCLSAWDGSSRAFVDLVKAGLRDPNSFEHAETRITPVNEKGVHMISMDYRARNGFGGMNAATAIGTVKQADCTVTLIALERPS